MRDDLRPKPEIVKGFADNLSFAEVISRISEFISKLRGSDSITILISKTTPDKNVTTNILQLFQNEHVHGVRNSLIQAADEIDKYIQEKGLTSSGEN